MASSYKATVFCMNPGVRGFVSRMIKSSCDFLIKQLDLSLLVQSCAFWFDSLQLCLCECFSPYMFKCCGNPPAASNDPKLPKLSPVICQHAWRLKTQTTKRSRPMRQQLIWETWKFSQNCMWPPLLHAQVRRFCALFVLSCLCAMRFELQFASCLFALCALLPFWPRPPELQFLSGILRPVLKG